jgi:hypothetical protein
VEVELKGVVMRMETSVNGGSGCYDEKRRILRYAKELTGGPSTLQPEFIEARKGDGFS